MKEFMLIRPPITFNSFRRDRLEGIEGIGGSSAPNYLRSWAVWDVKVIARRGRLELPSIRPPPRIGGIEGIDLGGLGLEGYWWGEVRNTFIPPQKHKAKLKHLKGMTELKVIRRPIAFNLFKLDRLEGDEAIEGKSGPNYLQFPQARPD